MKPPSLQPSHSSHHPHNSSASLSSLISLCMFERCGAILTEVDVDESMSHTETQTVANDNGLCVVIPVKELTQICREEGVEQVFVFVDAAHSIGCTGVDMQEIGADYYTLQMGWLWKVLGLGLRSIVLSWWCLMPWNL
ncbi:unnamed protein product [Vicia faba]|uniref:Aminotransferase class V domain-containing protein n=1 Tax=Vicia faba TaxID=3906 RepID=A0AAV1AZ61_VICFA|nr:unnamed protein product [Vicia faba]